MSLVCEKCGSLGIQEKAWTDVNTQKYISSVGSGDEVDNWCTICEKHVSFVDEEEYEQQSINLN